jgi:N-methylhydantoinase A
VSASASLVGVDVGGTFTDVVSIEGGELTAVKVPTNVSASELSVLQGAEEVQVERARVFNIASTAGLNAVITRALPKVAFLTTIGHRDVLDKGRVWRPYEALTDASWRRGFGDAARPIIPRYLRRGIRERILADGSVLVPLDEDQVRHELEILRRCGVKGVAICLLHSWVNPAHEVRLRELVEEVLPGLPTSISSEICPLAKEYPRATTTVVDLLMKIKYTDYTARLQDGLAKLGFQGEFNYADCSAMLVPASYAVEQPYRLVVGGPAAGTVASAHFGSVVGKTNLLCADVGGTSCDISVVIDGQPWVNDTFELEFDLLVNTLSTEIVTLGAGGGSIISIGAAGELRVGPDSAGAEPGPACYGKGGHRPTVTDAALLIGILAPDRFLGGKMPLREDVALQAFNDLDTSLPLSRRIGDAWTIGMHNVAEGLFDITIRRGIDPRDFSLIAFGAAGPMLLPGLLDLVPLESVIVPPNPGGFSAMGMLSSDQVFAQSRTLYGVLQPELAPRISALLQSMERELLERVGIGAGEAQVVRTFDARLLGQGWETPFIPVPDGDLGADSIPEMISNFHSEYEKRNGHRFDNFPVEGVIYRVQLIVPSEKVRYAELPARPGAGEPERAGTVILRHLSDDATEADCYERASLGRGDVIPGPAIIWEETSTTFVPLGRHATVGRHGEIVIV